MAMPSLLLEVRLSRCVDERENRLSHAAFLVCPQE